MVTEMLVNTCRPWLGAAAGTYPDLASDSESQIAGHEARIGRTLDVVHLYHGVGSRPLSSVDRYYATRANTIAFINWKPTANWGDAGGSNPTVNAEIDAAADGIRSLGSTKVLLTLYHEPEDDVSGGASGCTTYKGAAGTPADYRAMWRNVRERFTARGVVNAVFVMNYMGAQQWDCMVDDLWPGDDLVDWVMWDPYSEAASFQATVGRFYDFLGAHADATHDYTSKAWGLGEWGVWRGATQAFTYQYYDEARASIAANEFPRLKVYSIFDYGGSTPQTTQIGYDAHGTWDPAEVEHYRALANDPVFLDSPLGVPDTPDPPPNDPVVPMAPTGLVAIENMPTQVTLQWQRNPGDGDVAAFVIVRDGVAVGASFAGNAYEDLDVQPGTTYIYSVAAMDQAGRFGPFSDDLVVATPAIGDSEPPTSPTGLRAVSSSGGVTLTWIASADDVDVDGYAVFDGPARIATASGTTIEVGGLRAGYSYMFTVRAFDAAGNISGPSNLSAARAGV